MSGIATRASAAPSAVRQDAWLSGLPDALRDTLGMGGPVAAGFLTGHMDYGLAAALGGLAVSGSGREASLGGRWSGLIYAVLAGSTGMLVGSVLAGGTWATSLPLIAAIAGLVGGMSRPMARSAAQFILFTIIAMNIGPGHDQPLGLALLFFTGGVWAAAVTLMLRPLIRMALAAGLVAETATPVKYPARLLLRRWWKLMSYSWGWQYALRIGLCLAAAGAYKSLWPGHHGYWAELTVVIVVQRNLEGAWRRSLERAAGTVIGVVLVNLLLLYPWPLRGLIVLIAVLAALRSMLLETNYIAYAAVHTPLIILFLDFSQASSMVMAFDRLAATLAGCALALVFGYLGWSGLKPPVHMAIRRG